MTPVCDILHKFQPQMHCSTPNEIGSSHPPLCITRWVKPSQNIWKLKACWFYDTKPSKHLTGFWPFLLYSCAHALKKSIIKPQFLYFWYLFLFLISHPPSFHNDCFFYQILLFLATKEQIFKITHNCNFIKKGKQQIYPPQQQVSLTHP